MAIQSEKFTGKITSIGNSKGIRLEAAFFKTHPEFNGDVTAVVLADGQVLLSARDLIRSEKSEEDPVLIAFLKFLEKDLIKNPEKIIPADEKQLLRIKKLVDGVETDN